MHFLVFCLRFSVTISYVCIFFYDFLGVRLSFLGTGLRRAKGSLQRAHHRADSGEDLTLNSSCHLANASFPLSKRQRRLGTIETNRNGRTKTAPVNSFSSETGSTESWRV